MKITEHRAKELLHWHDDMAGDHTVLFEAMTAHRDTAALIRQLQAEVQDAWQAGLDAGREQGRIKDHAHQPPSVPVGVGGLPRYGFPDGNEPRPVPYADGYWTPWHLAQQPAAVDEDMVFRMAVWMAKNDGHDDPHHLIWEGSPPEPWGEVWNRYEDDARAALTAALATQPGEE